MAKEKKDDKGGDNGDAKQRTRSPSYPSIGLEEAIRRAGLLYERVHGRKTGPDAVASILGTNTKSSAFLQGISALKQFGLLDDYGQGQGRQLAVSGLAQDILVRDEQSPERCSAIKTAALTPKLHAELWDKYGGHLPAADSPIRVYLLREREAGKFHPDHADGFISQFRGTVTYANLSPADTIPGADGDAPPATEDRKMTSSTPAPMAAASWLSPPKSQPGLRQLPITMPSDLSVAVLSVKVPMTETDYKTLVSTIASMKDAMTAVKADEPTK